MSQDTDTSIPLDIGIFISTIIESFVTVTPLALLMVRAVASSFTYVTSTLSAGLKVAISAFIVPSAT